MPRSRKFSNDTLDVINKGCLDLFDNVACGRISILLLLSAVTFLFVMLKIIRYHAYKHSQVHHYAIFYTTAAQCIVCAASFLFGVRYPQLDFAANFLKLLQFILICHFHWSVAAKSRHRDDIVQHVINPVLCLYTLYCVTVVLMGMVDIGDTWTECLRAYWLMLSSADFISVQLFAIVALCVTYSNKHSTISVLMLPTVSTQTRDLWLITAVYELSAVVSIVFDATMSLTGKEETGCSGIYSHKQLYYSLITSVIAIVKYFLPTWTLLAVFQPSRVKSRPSEVALTSHYNTDGTFHNQYRRTFFTKNFDDLQSSVLRSNGTYTTNSPIYGGFGDYSYSDSSPDTSQSTKNCWSGKDDESFSGFDKHFINADQRRDSIENQCKIDQNCHNLERNLGLDILDGEIIIQNDRNLSTISEETGNVSGQLQE